VKYEISPQARFPRETETVPSTDCSSRITLQQVHIVMRDVRRISNHNVEMSLRKIDRANLQEIGFEEMLWRDLAIDNGRQMFESPRVDITSENLFTGIGAP
jgi:hypothetical protein